MCGGPGLDIGSLSTREVLGYTDLSGYTDLDYEILEVYNKN